MRLSRPPFPPNSHLAVLRRACAHLLAPPPPPRVLAWLLCFGFVFGSIFARINVKVVALGQMSASTLCAAVPLHSVLRSLVRRVHADVAVRRIIEANRNVFVCE